MTPLTKQRRALLEWTFEACRVHRAEPSEIGRFLRRDPDILAAFRACAPKRKPAWGDMVGRALWSCRDWLAGMAETEAGKRGLFDAPMRDTVREIAAALGEPMIAHWGGSDV